MNKQALMDAAKQAGIEELEIYEGYSKTTSLQVYEQKVDSFTISECTSWRVRGFFEGRMGMVNVEKADDTMIPFILQAIKENANAITSEDEQEIYEGDQEYPVIETTKNTCLDAQTGRKVALLRSLEQQLQGCDPRIVQVMETAYEDVIVKTSIDNTRGMHLTKDDTKTMVVASVLAKDGEDQKSAYEVATLLDLDTFDRNEFVQGLKDKVINKLHAKQIASGTYPVIIERDAMQSLLRQVFNQFHGDLAAKGISLLKDALDTAIFDEKVTLIDDPLMKDGICSAPFDDEGVACRRKIIVEHGVLKTFLHNLKSAKLMNTVSTGNGFGQDIAYTNYYMEPGSTSYEALMKQMGTGVIINELNGLHAGWNIVTTQFSLQASGFYVENGVIAHPINLITIAGNFLELMKDITCIGSDLKYSYTGVGAPSVLFPSIAVSGE